MYVMMSDLSDSKRQLLFITTGRKRTVYIHRHDDITGEDNIYIGRREFPNILHAVFFKKKYVHSIINGIATQTEKFVFYGHFVYDEFGNIKDECLGDAFYKELGEKRLKEEELPDVSYGCVERFFSTAFGLHRFIEGRYINGIMPGDNPSCSIPTDYSNKILYIGKGYSVKELKSDLGITRVTIKKED